VVAVLELVPVLVFVLEELLVEAVLDVLGVLAELEELTELVVI